MKKINYKDLVKRYYEDLWNKQNRDMIDVVFADDITFRGSLNMEAKGKEQFKEYMDNILNGIPNLYHGIETIIEEDGLVAVRAVYNGTHRGELFGIEPTNRRIKYNGASFFRFREDKICDVWVLGDLVTLKDQITEKK